MNESLGGWDPEEKCSGYVVLLRSFVSSVPLSPTHQSFRATYEILPILSAFGWLIPRDFSPFSSLFLNSLSWPFYNQWDIFPYFFLFGTEKGVGLTKIDGRVRRGAGGGGGGRGVINRHKRVYWWKERPTHPSLSPLIHSEGQTELALAHGIIDRWMERTEIIPPVVPLSPSLPLSVPSTLPTHSFWPRLNSFCQNFASKAPVAKNKKNGTFTGSVKERRDGWAMRRDQHTQMVKGEGAGQWADPADLHREECNCCVRIFLFKNPCPLI